MDEKQLYLERLHSLIKTGKEENIELAIQLAKGQGVSEQRLMRDWNSLLYFVRDASQLPYELSHIFDLKKLSYNDQLLFGLPKRIGDLSALESLQINACSLKAVPDGITLLSELKILGLGRNHLLDLPAEIGNLSKLEYLELTNNELGDLPDSLVALEQLKTLNLYLNPISCLPDGMERLKNLKTLDLTKTTLWSFEETIEKLAKTNLKEFSLAGNDLETLPSNIKYLQGLEQWNLSDNNFSIKEKERIQSLVPNCRIHF